MPTNKSPAARRSLRFFVWTMVAALALSAGTVRDSIAATKIVAGTVFLSSTVWTEFVADAKGYFKERDLEVEIIPTRSSSKAAQQLAAGSLHIASSGIPDYLRAIDQGAPIKIFKTQLGTPPYTIFARPEISSIKDLKGKKVMIGGPKDVTRYYVETLFRKHGLEPGSYDYLYAGSTGNRFAALSSGGVDATIILPPLSFRAKAEGLTNLGNIQTVLADFPFTVHGYNTDWASRNRQALVDYTAALMKATEWLYDTRNREEAADILVKATKFKKEDALLNYDAFIKEMKAISRGGEVTEGSYKKMMQVLVGWGDINPPIPPLARFYDSSILADAKKSLNK